MIYITDNKPRKISYTLLDRAVLFSVDFLRIRDNLVLEIIFENEDGSSTYCGSSDVEGRVAKIWINPKMKKRDILVTLFHEMVHIQQILSKRLVVGCWHSPARWLGEEIIANYNDLPWEVEAYQLEEDMMNQFEEIINKRS